MDECFRDVIMRHGRLFPSLLLLALAGCSSTPPATAPSVPGVTPPPASSGKPAATTPPAVTPPPASAPQPAAPQALSYRPQRSTPPLADGSQLPAVQGLLAASDRALRAGDLDLAASNLERAQRLAPQSTAVYQRLAEIRLRQKRPAEAEQMARKALGFTAQPAQQALLWRQIAAARQQLGQAQSAQEALQRATALEGGSAP